MSPHLTAMLAGGGHQLAPGSSTGDTGFSFTQDSGKCITQGADRFRSRLFQCVQNPSYISIILTFTVLFWLWVCSMLTGNDRIHELSAVTQTVTLESLFQLNFIHIQALLFATVFNSPCALYCGRTVYIDMLKNRPHLVWILAILLLYMIQLSQQLIAGMGDEQNLSDN